MGFGMSGKPPTEAPGRNAVGDDDGRAEVDERQSRGDESAYGCEDGDDSHFESEWFVHSFVGVRWLAEGGGLRAGRRSQGGRRHRQGI